MQEQDYLIVRTKQGYFITPGNNVTLPSVKVIGKDIIFDEDADIMKLIESGELQYKKKALAAPLQIE